jgi:membrane-bound serine protease (ClpP class)
MDTGSNLILAYVLIGVGFLLMVGELFLPSGTLLLLALTSIAAGVGLAFYHSSSTGLFTLVAVLVALPLFGGMLARYWSRSRMGRRMILSTPEEDATVASMPVNLELERLRGRHGRAVSDLRPSGVCDFDGWRVDTITEGLMVEAGQLVRCVDVRAGKVIVRPVDQSTAINELENLDNLDLS